MKKKIIIVSDSLRIGGIQKSLVNLLNNFDYEKYDVSLFLFNDENSDLINKKVKVIKSNYIFRIIGKTSKEAKKSSIFQYTIRIFLSLLCKLFTSQIIFNFAFLTIQFKEKYDIAISYSNNLNNKSLYYGYNQLVLKKIKAKMKCCWIHIDYIKRNKLEWEYNEYKQFDKIILVSNSCKANFDKLYPDLKDKTFVVYNYLDNKIIINDSKKLNPNFQIENIILSIGRLEKDKNFEMQINIAKKLKENNLEFIWYVIGEGGNRKNLEELITKYNLTNNFILLGEKRNVYPYIKNAKLLVSTSLTESFGLTIAESLVLKTPIVSLKYPALAEIIDDNGIICKNQKEIYDSIFNLLINKKEYIKLKEKSIYKINNKQIEEQIENVFERD